MKKFMALALALALALSLTACAGGNSGGDTSAPPANNSDSTPSSGGGTTTAPESTPSDKPGATGLDESTVKWPDDDFTKMIPKPTAGKVATASSLPGVQFVAQINELTETADFFNAYVEDCEAKGWSGEVTTDGEGSSTFYSFGAMNGDWGMQVDFSESSGTLGIMIVKP